MSNKIKHILLTQIFIFVIFCLTLSPASSKHNSYYSEKCFLSDPVETVTINYYFDGTLIHTAELNKGTSLSLPDISDLKNMLECSFSSNEYDFQAKTVEWHLSSVDGEYAGKDFSADSDTDLHAVIVATDKTVNYELIYDYFSAENFKTKNYTFDYGENVAINNIDGVNIAGFYKDPFYKQKSVLPETATENKTYYVKLNKIISYTLNGKTFNALYGTSLNDIKETETYIYEDFYLDENHKVKYVYTLLDGLILYADQTRTAYTLTVIDDGDRKTIYVPVSDNTIIKSSLIGDANKYYYYSGTEVAFPLKIEKDVVIYTEVPSVSTDNDSSHKTDSKKSSLSENDAVVLIVVGCVLAFVIIASVLYEKIFKKRITEYKVKKNAKKK